MAINVFSRGHHALVAACFAAVIVAGSGVLATPATAAVTRSRHSPNPAEPSPPSHAVRGPRITHENGAATAAGKSILIYGPSLDGSPNNEQTLAEAAGYSVTVADASTWASMTTAQFASYNSIVLGDPTCGSDPSILDAAVANQSTWAAAVTGPAVVIGTDPVYHQSQAGVQADQLITNGINFAAGGSGTGLYADLSCYYYTSAPNTPVPLLTPFGTFTVEADVTGCDSDISIVNPSSPVVAGIDNSGLSGWSCSVHEVFDTYPPSFTPIVDDTDFTPARPYILASSNPARFTFSAKFGEEFSGLVARLRPSGGAADIGHDSATIAWGDGSVTQATLAPSAGDPSELDVSGSHTYWTAGTLPVTITVNDPHVGVSTFQGTAKVSSQYTAMGDSYSSGEGADWPPGESPQLAGCDWPLYQDPSGSPHDTDHIDGAYLSADGNCIHPPFTTFVGNTCHRADTAYPHVVQRLLSGLDMTLRFVSCSGDVVQEAFTAASQVHHDQVHQGEDPQVKALGPSTSLVTLTFGGNNLDFPRIAQNCVTSTDDYGCLNQDGKIVDGLGYKTKPGNPDDGTFTSSHVVQHAISDFQKTVVKLIGSGRDCLNPGCDLHDALVVLYRAIKAKAPGARILVLGYPHFFPAGGTGNTCEHFSSLDQQWANDRVNLVDAVIKDAAAESGVAQYVDTYNALAGHEECTGDPHFTVDPSTYQVTGCADPGQWINGIDLVAGFFGTPENLHPNPCGHLAEGAVAADAYASPPPPDPAGIASSDTFTLTANQKSAATTLSVPPGLTRLNITANWPTGSVAFTLTDPSGASYPPVQEGSAGQVYTTWDLNKPPAGTWTLTETDTTTGDTGSINGTLTINEASMPELPPAPQITVVRKSCVLGFATLSASVSHKADARVAQYQWFDDNGQPQQASGPKGDTIIMHSVKNQYRVIVLTTGTDGQHRFTTATVSC